VSDSQIHWVAIINSIMIAFFLTAMVAMIMMRTLRADLRRYHEMETQEEAQEETGWKLVHGDVFRPPSNPLLLSVLVGSGVQIISMSVITLIFALLGFLSPANRGGLMTAMVVLYVLMGYVVEMCSVCCTVPHSLAHTLFLSLSLSRSPCIQYLCWLLLCPYLQDF
jgi:transmembrane 9 superfamily member 2/4